MRNATAFERAFDFGFFTEAIGSGKHRFRLAIYLLYNRQTKKITLLASCARFGGGALKDFSHAVYVYGKDIRACGVA
jgi:hypothetical protein